MTDTAKPRRRHTIVHSYVDARCQNCEWQSQAANGIGGAAIHHDRTGHIVQITATRNMTYGNPDGPAGQIPGQLDLDGQVQQ